MVAFAVLAGNDGMVLLTGKHGDKYGTILVATLTT
jgi:hypothetical protein